MCVCVVNMGTVEVAGVGGGLRSYQAWVESDDHVPWVVHHAGKEPWVSVLMAHVPAPWS